MKTHISTVVWIRSVEFLSVGNRIFNGFGKHCVVRVMVSITYWQCSKLCSAQIQDDISTVAIELLISMLGH